MFYHQYNWEEAVGEGNSQISMVDPSGYVSPKQRIENLIRAGERLDEFRREQYDYDTLEEDDGEWTDPMRTPGLDLADVHRIRQETLRRMSSRAARGEDSERPPEKQESSVADVIATEAADNGSST